MFPEGFVEDAREQRAQKLLVSRLTGMGLEVELLPGGRCARFELALRPTPFPGLAGPVEIGRAVLATVGSQHAKCVAPTPLFQLPMVSLAQCTSAEQIEDAIRATWARHGQKVRDAANRMRQMGVRVGSEAGGTVVTVPLGLEDPDTRGRMHQKGRLILPSRGLLSGVRLERPEERVMAIEGGFDSSIDLELAVSSRLESLSRKAAKIAEGRRRAYAASPVPQLTATPPAARKGRRRILLVGAILGRDQALQRALRQLGFKTRLEYSAADALTAFQEESFDVVLTDTHLGRSEGIELIPQINRLPGVEKMPVVLVDEHARPPLRRAAKEVGATGYLVHPIEPAKVLSGLERMADGRARGRRFERVDHRLEIDWEGDPGGFTRSIGRGGLFVSAERRVHAPHDGVLIRLPELGERLRVDALPVYARDENTGEPGIGLRFEGFPDRNEAVWIEYLTALIERENSSSPETRDRKGR